MVHYEGDILRNWAKAVHGRGSLLAAGLGEGYDARQIEERLKQPAKPNPPNSPPI